MTLKQGIQVAGVFVLFAATFYPVYPEWFSTLWNQADNSHGLLVPFVSLGLIWIGRDRLRQDEVSTSGAGLVLMACSLGVYLLALVGGVAVMTRIMFVFSLAGMILFLFGWNVFRPLVFPLFFLLFMVPVPVSVIGLVTLPLQSFATRLSSEVIQYCSIPVLREGNMLYFVNSQLEVAEACSGIRSLVAMVMLGTLFGYLSRQPLWIKGLLLLSTVPVAMFANILRISGTGVLAHFFGDQVARGFLHEFSGLAVFIFGFLLLGLEYLLLTKLFRLATRPSLGGECT